MESYWKLSVNRPEFAAITSDMKVDVAVIGGGITGITSAFLLKKAGAKVALIERGDMHSHGLHR